MYWEFDHLILFVRPGAPEADRLRDFGLSEGSSNSHPGQGTANRRFFFASAMIELLWIANDEESATEPASRLGLNARTSVSNERICPIGIALRPMRANAPTPPFTCWEYRPSYLPDERPIGVATNSELAHEPLLVTIPFAQRPDAQPDSQQEPIDHATPLREVTRTTLISPFARAASSELNTFIKYHRMQLEQGNAFHIELGFDGEKAAQQHNFAPVLPLTLCW